MEIVGLAAIMASFLWLVLTVYGVFYNGRATRALIEAIREDIAAVREDIRATREDTLSYLKEMDRRHTELMGIIAKRP